jgi:hypothetical protein
VPRSREWSWREPSHRSPQTGRLAIWELVEAYAHCADRRDAVERVTAIGRRKLGMSHSKLDEVLH